MAIYKVESIQDEKTFVPTLAYRKLYTTFQGLKNQRGRFIHIIGSPGTGKSINLYHALHELDLNVYVATLLLDDVDQSSREIFKEIFTTLKVDLGLKTKEEVYRKASQFDAVLFADKFLDPEFLHEDKIGLSKWMDYQGYKSIPFYLLCVLEYLKHKGDLNRINLILHHSWIIKIRGEEYDLFADLGPLSWIMAGILKLLFEVVEISYQESEIMEIVKNHPNYTGQKQIKLYIQKYGKKPRAIYKAMEDDSIHSSKY